MPNDWDQHARWERDRARQRRHEQSTAGGQPRKGCFKSSASALMLLVGIGAGAVYGGVEIVRALL